MDRINTTVNWEEEAIKFAEANKKAQGRNWQKELADFLAMLEAIPEAKWIEAGNATLAAVKSYKNETKRQLLGTLFAAAILNGGQPPTAEVAPAADKVANDLLQLWEVPLE